MICLNSNLFTHIIYVHHCNEVKSTKKAVQTYLSDILANKRQKYSNTSYNGTDFKNKAPNEACSKLGMKKLLSNQLHPQGNARVENVHNFLK